MHTFPHYNCKRICCQNVEKIHAIIKQGKKSALCFLLFIFCGESFLNFSISLKNGWMPLLEHWWYLQCRTEESRSCYYIISYTQSANINFIQHLIQMCNEPNCPSSIQSCMHKAIASEPTRNLWGTYKLFWFSTRSKLVCETVLNEATIGWELSSLNKMSLNSQIKNYCDALVKPEWAIYPVILAEHSCVELKEHWTVRMWYTVCIP